MKILIGIPAYNEEQTVSSVIKSIPKKIDKINKIDIVVVNDGSKDATARVAESSKATILNHIINRGLGGALKTIFAYGKLLNYDIIVTFDADGQHDSRDLSCLIRPIVENKTDVVIGTRWKKNKNVPFSRLIVNKIANIITFLLFGVWSTDSQSGFRAFGKKAIQLINLQSDGMEVSSEFFREIFRNKLRYTEVPINTIYTNYSKSKGQKLSNAPNVFFQLLLKLLR